jgi:sulfite reductase alpha subunit-like flavoprotein
MWIKPGMFDLPPPSTHLLLIGPGTGVAPMRSIIQERKFLRLNSEGEKEKIKHGETHLYFGCRHEKKV